MVWRRIFVPLYGENGDAAVLSAAGRLADDFNAHLDVVLVKPDPAMYVPPIGIGRLADEMRAELVKSAEEACNETEATLREAFDATVAKEGLSVVDEPHGPGVASARFSTIAADEAEETGLRYARASDVVIVAMPSKEHRDGAAAFAERLLLKSGRPVLAIPPRGLPAEINRIGVAWDGDEQVVRAFAASLPFLEMADMIDIVSVVDNLAVHPYPEDIVEYLSWRGIIAEAHVLETNYRTVGERLVEFMDERNWDMIVMGAYGRGRFIERFFAGPTRGVPWEAKIPVLQCH